MFLPSTPSAIGLFIALSYGLTAIPFVLWRTLLASRTLGEESPAAIASVIFKAIAVSCMFIPFLSLYLLSLIYHRPQSFVQFVFMWLRIDLRSLVAFLLAPIPPIVALVVYIETVRAMGMLKVDTLRQIVGLESFASLKAFRVLGIGYAAGVTVNALVAIGEEMGWRAYLTPSLIEHVGILTAIIIVGIVWGLWHTPIIFSTRSLIKKLFPWISIKQVLINYVISCAILSYPLYLLLISSGSILPPAAFHGTINALWQIPQFVTEIRDKHRHKDMAKVALASIIAWSIAIVITLALVQIINAVT